MTKINIIDNNVLQGIETLGDKYIEKHLSKWKNKQLHKSWWEALNFFFSHSFMRGRRDSLSVKYCEFTIETLEDFETSENLKPNTVLNRLENLKSLLKPPKGELKNDMDVKMVLDTLKFITSDKEKHNIYEYALQKIKNDKTDELYNELNGIYGIGDKIATFYIRDILLLNPDIKIKREDIKYAFPIDTWVLTISGKLNINEQKVDEIKKNFIDNSTNYNLCPYKIAAGLWYLGFNSLDILLENISCLSNIKK